MTGLFRLKNGALPIANVLQAQGDLEMRTAKLKEAEAHYKESEELYRRIHADLGLANVLQAQGDLLQKKADYRNALDVYMDAIELYEKTGGMIGLAYSLSELCYCYAKTSDVGNVATCAEKVETILKGLPYKNVKAYCKNKIRSALELIG